MAASGQDSLAGLGGQTGGVQVGGQTTTLVQVAESAAPAAAAAKSANPLTAFAAALQSLSLFESTYEGVEILAALINQDYDAGGELQDTVDVTFGIIGRPGQFQVHPLFTIDWQAQASFLIGVKRAIVEAIYDELPNLGALPSAGAGGAPIPQPGVAVPV